MTAPAMTPAAYAALHLDADMAAHATAKAASARQAMLASGIAPDDHAYLTAYATRAEAMAAKLTRQERA